MIEWMYQDRSAFNKTEQTAEEYLLGKEVKEGDLQATEKSKAESARDKFTKGLTFKGDRELQENYTTNENEAFLRLKEDPLMMIRQREMEMRQEVLNNPMTLKKIQKEIQKLKDAKSSKKHKKDKKDKKRKHRRSRSRSGSSESRRSDDSRRHHRAKERRHNSEYERLKSEVDALKSGRSLAKPAEARSDLGPDMTLYGDRLREMQESERLRKA